MVAPTCVKCQKQPASGIWQVHRVVFFEPRVDIWLLCAECGLAHRLRRYNDGSEHYGIQRMILLVSFARETPPPSPGGLKADVVTHIAPVSPGVIAAAEYRASLNRPQSRIHPSVLNQVDWSYR